MWYPGQCNAKLVLRVRTAFVKGFSGITRPARPLIIIARSQNSELCDRYGSWRGRFDAGDPSNPFWFPVDCSVASPSYSVDGHAGIAKGTEETVPDGRTTTVRRFPRRFSTSYTLCAYDAVPCVYAFPRVLQRRANDVRTGCGIYSCLLWNQVPRSFWNRDFITTDEIAKKDSRRWLRNNVVCSVRRGRKPNDFGRGWRVPHWEKQGRPRENESSRAFYLYAIITGWNDFATWTKIRSTKSTYVYYDGMKMTFEDNRNRFREKRKSRIRKWDFLFFFFFTINRLENRCHSEYRTLRTRSFYCDK